MTNTNKLVLADAILRIRRGLIRLERLTPGDLVDKRKHVLQAQQAAQAQTPEPQSDHAAE